MPAGKNKRTAPKNKEDVPQRRQPKRVRVVEDEIVPEVVERCDILADVETPKKW